MAPAVSGMAEWIKPKIRARLLLSITSGSALVVAIVLSVSSIGKVKRDRDLISDVHQIAVMVGEGAMVSVSPDLRWSRCHVHAYFARLYKISFDSHEARHQFLITPVQSEFRPEASYEKTLADDLSTLALFKRADQ